MNLGHGCDENISLGIISKRDYVDTVGREGGTEMSIIVVTAIVAVVCLGLLAGVAAAEAVTA
jgi:hypothetical protein